MQPDSILSPKAHVLSFPTHLRGPSDPNPRALRMTQALAPRGAPHGHGRRHRWRPRGARRTQTTTATIGARHGGGPRLPPQPRPRPRRATTNTTTITALPAGPRVPAARRRPVGRRHAQGRAWRRAVARRGPPGARPRGRGVVFVEEEEPGEGGGRVVPGCRGRDRNCRGCGCVGGPGRPGGG